jgi:hypothetical protein
MGRMDGMDWMDGMDDLGERGRVWMGPGWRWGFEI